MSRRLAILPALAVAAGAVLVSLSGTPAAGSEPDFVDTAGTGYEEAVAALADAGVIRGCSEDEFCPYEPLTRAQMATVMVNALNLPLTEFRHFTDISGNVHESNINALAESRITRGCESGLFCPSRTLTRAELATLVARAFDVPAVDAPYFDDTQGVHAPAIDALAAHGIVAGCGDPLTSFCPNEPVLRWQAALFVSRAMELVDRVEVTTLEEREILQAEIEAEEERLRLEEEERLRQEEEERERQREREAMWDRLAECEANGNWQHISRNGLYYGGLQFHLQTWNSFRPSHYPSNPINATREQQIFVAERVLAVQGWNAWPTCSRLLGLR